MADEPRRLVDHLAYLSVVLIPLAYLATALTGDPIPLHLANGLGGLPLLAVEARARTWQPLILTATFCVVGWLGLAMVIFSS